MSVPGTPHQVPLVELVITEELDEPAVPRLARALLEALELHPAHLVVDLAGCTRIDAAAIGLLLDIHRRTLREGGTLTLRSPSPRLRRNLRLASVDRVIDIIPRQDATHAAPPSTAMG